MTAYAALYRLGLDTTYFWYAKRLVRTAIDESNADLLASLGGVR